MTESKAIKEVCNWHPIIAIPARNEAQRIPALIDSLGQQSWLGAKGRRLHVVIALNNCTDNSRSVATWAAGNHPALIVNLIEVEFSKINAHVGSARHLAMEQAFAARPHPSRSVLITTDADAVPEPTWVEANLCAIKAGADMVGGLIVGDKAEEALLGDKFCRRAARHLQYMSLSDRLSALIDPLPYDPWPRHSDHTGASLAVRADVYAAVGGLPALPFREDLAFVSRVRGAGYRVRHSLDVRVKVSARLEGRAPGGMADCIKRWVEAEKEGMPHLVEAPHAVAARLGRRRLCRDLGNSTRSEFIEVSSALGFGSSGWATQNIPALIELMAPDEPDAMSSVPVESAIGQIQQLIAVKERQNRAA
jgi:hypothetical protein